MSWTADTCLYIILSDWKQCNLAPKFSSRFIGERRSVSSLATEWWEATARHIIRVPRYNTENVIRVPRYNTENVILRCAVQKSPRILGEIWVFWSNIGDLSILVFLTQQQLLWIPLVPWWFSALSLQRIKVDARLLLQWSEMRILGPMCFGWNHWVLNRRQVSTVQGTRLT